MTERQLIVGRAPFFIVRDEHNSNSVEGDDDSASVELTM